MFSKTKATQQKDLSIVCTGVERKTLIDYIRNRQDAFLEKDPHNKIPKLEPIKKQ